MTLWGSWVKVKFNDYEGFLFDAYLSKIKYEKDKFLHEILIDQKEICNEYSLKRNNFNPNSNSSPNIFINKLKKRFNTYYELQ